MRYQSVVAFVAAAFSYSLQVKALTVNLSSTGRSISSYKGFELTSYINTDSIKSAASTIAYGMMQFYTGETISWPLGGC